MSRREEKRKAYSSMLMPDKKEAPGTESKSGSENICGICKQYLESSWSSDGRGTCKLLKLGSDIKSQPPVYVLEGKDGYPTKTLSDASLCKYFEKMTFIDKDGYECSDPLYRRSMRQLRDKK